MNTLTPTLKFFLNLAKVQAVMSRRFDSRLGGLGYSEFQILLHLTQAKGETMRRIDLAEKLGLTASGITRLLAPMEKIGLVKRESDKDDARVSSVTLASGGRTKLANAMEDAIDIAEAAIPAARARTMKDSCELMIELAHSVR